MPYQVVPRSVLEAKYFYPVGRNRDVFIGTPSKVTTPVQPEEARMIIEEGTWIVYIVDAEGRLYMQPPESFDPKILNAPLMKTVPLPAVEFQRLITPPPSPPSSSSQRAPAHQSGYSPVLNTYTGRESSRWAEDRHQRSSAEYYPQQQQQQVQYSNAVPVMQYPQPMQWVSAPTHQDQYLHVRPSSSYPSTTSATHQHHGHRRTHSSQSAKKVHFADE
ncbi:hypothetical protein CPB86DRAFT_811877 [Serendipita vermifera]|nr:hypothetical protein CPB86DRAFT_811877 [Serendipita vermifera]